MSAAVRRIVTTLDRHLTNVDAANPLCSHDLRVAAAQLNAQAEMIERGLRTAQAASPESEPA